MQGRADALKNTPFSDSRGEISFHQAATNKDVDAIVALFADDATLMSGGKTYSGKAALC